MLCSARVTLVMLTVNAESESENMSVQLDREIQFRTTVINSSVYSGIPAAVQLERKDTICHVHRTNTKSNGTANQIRIHISLYS